MTAMHTPTCCNICGHYLTTIDSFTGNRCLDPRHWQAAGLLSPDDFYTMAQIAALARIEDDQGSSFNSSSATLR